MTVHTIDFFSQGLSSDPFLTIEECEIELIKKQAFIHLKEAMKAYRDESLLKKYSWFEVSFYQLMMLKAFWKPSEEVFKHHFQLYLNQIKELKKRGVHLSSFEPVDLLLEGYANTCLLKSLTSSQKKVLADLCCEDKQDLFRSMQLAVYLGLSVLPLQGLHSFLEVSIFTKTIISSLTLGVVINIARVSFLYLFSKDLTLPAKSFE